MRTTAGLRPPLLVTCVRASQTSFFRRQTLARQHKSGGRQPPVECTQRTRTRSAEIRRIGIADGVYKPTAGLHPPLLVLCVSASQTSFFRRQTSAHQHKSGGRQPPVALINANATAIRTHTVGGLPTNGARVCRCVFAHPRRAYARRSWYCAFVHRKRRYFTGERSCCNQERGASAPRGRPSCETQRTGETQAPLAIASAHPTGKKRTLNANGCIEGRSGRNHLKSSLSIHPAKPIGVSSRRTFRDNRDSEGRPYICRNR
jgi:hypothetical protein